MADDPLVEHARRELTAAGAFGDPVYGGQVGRDVLELIETFSRQGHSGYSAGIAIHYFVQLAQFHPLPKPPAANPCGNGYVRPSGTIYCDLSAGHDGRHEAAGIGAWARG